MRMNLISNNCVGPSLYALYGEKFDHPFVWGAFDLDDFIYLANNYEKIEYTNTEYDLETRLYQTRKSVICNIDNKVKYHFSHYMYDQTMKEPGRCDTYKHTLLYNNIIALTREKYMYRKERMQKDPTFLYCYNLICPTSKEYLIILDRLLEIKRRLIIVMHEGIDIGDRNIPDNVTILRLPKEDMVLCANVVAEALDKKYGELFQNLRK